MNRGISEITIKNFIEDIFKNYHYRTCFLDGVIPVINSYEFSKNAVEKIIQRELNKNTKNYYTIRACLECFNNQLLSTSKDYYYSLNSLEVIKKCLTLRSGKIINLSKEIIFRLFLNLYMEYCMLSPESVYGKKHIKSFRKLIGLELIKKIAIDLKLYNYPDYINGLAFFKKHGLKYAKSSSDGNEKIDQILSEFYEK